MLLSSHAWSYASLCIQTLLSHADEQVHLSLICDDRAEAATLATLLAGLDMPDRPDKTLEIVPKEDVSDRLQERYGTLYGLRALHNGHPCWRKITDPLILGAPEDEMIVVDPDLFFPNIYRFEPTPETGVMMMRQSPNCLYPPEAVRQVFELGVPLANHVDIGVAQVRVGAVDMDWLDWFASALDLEKYRPFMHIEAIIWSALAMRMGGEHLNPSAWRCWERGHLKRLAVAAGVPGQMTLRFETVERLKCIHVSGPSKLWLAEAIGKSSIKATLNRYIKPVAGIPYRELTPEVYAREQWLKGFAARLGYYRLTNRG